MKLEQLIFFLFHFFVLDCTRICRYFRLNLLVTRFSIGKIRGINCYSFPLQINLSSKSHHKSHLLSFFDSRSKINFYLDYISILSRLQISMYIYQIVASCNKYFNIVASGIFVLFQQCDEEQIRERDFHFQSPSYFIYFIEFQIC